LLCLSVMEDRQKKSVLEMLLFLSGEPLTVKDMKAVTGFSDTEITDLMDELISEYGERRGGMLISRIAEGYQMHTNRAYVEFAVRFRGTAKPQKLSMPALETLAIIAYRQPLTKVEVEEIRGVNADGVVKTLLDRRMIKIVGRKEAPGKPLLYGTTREFLEYFGLKDLTELPTLKDLEREEAA
jgi:segregation and condensation protein B